MGYVAKYLPSFVFFYCLLLCDGSKSFSTDIFKTLAQKSILHHNVQKEIGMQILSRSRRQLSSSIKINFINKSGRTVRVYMAYNYGYYAYLSRQFDLRPNEPRGINGSPGTVWVARDIETGLNMLVNGNTRFYIRGRQKSNGFLDVKIRNPPYLNRKLSIRNLPPIPEKFLRVKVIADASVTNHYGKDKIQNYLITVMNIVSKIFKDKSLGIKINIIVSEIHALERDPSSLKIVENDPDSSITNACNFASTLKKDNRQSNHDFVVVLTRKAIGPSGYAAMYTMCTKQSCTLVKESGFSTAYVIAHETGHALGIDHDGEDKECETDKLKGSIMAPKVYSKHERYHWSACSKRALYENIGYFKCLDKKPSAGEANEKTKFVEMPGEMFTKSEQCRHRLGKQASACYVFYGACTFLWCRLGFWAPCRVVLNSSPLEGTFCGTNKWCRKGRCLLKKEQAVNGKWGAWSEFSNCEGFCDAGIRLRRRKCDKPSPKNGGKKCPGEDRELEACKLKKCVSNEVKNVARENKCKSLGNTWKFFDAEATARDLTKSNMSCDFESGPCGWKNDIRDRLDWVLHSGPTRSSGTGPTNDHTLATSKGHYVYLEASWVKAELKPVKGDSARMVSLPIKAYSICFSFYYHMYGDRTGSLRVVLASSNKPQRVLWSKKGSQGNEWKFAELTVNSLLEFQIVLEAIRGDGYRSDIAIDDVSARIGSCAKKDIVDPCMTNCFSSDNIGTRQIQVDNGTSCYSNESLDVCFEGKCKKIGCDYKFGSSKEFDECGVCGGDGSSCKIVKTKKTVTADKSLKEVFVIPEGAENITVKLESHPWLFAGVFIDDVSSTNVFNADGHRWPSGNYSVKSNEFIYQRTESGDVITILKLVNVGCRIVVFNPFSKELNVDQPKVQVSLSVKLPLTKDFNQFQYNVKSWTPCSKSCGGGIQHPVLTCMEYKSDRQLTDLYCNDIVSSDVELSRACNVQECNQRFNWFTGEWTPCSTECGPGSQTREVKCLDKRLDIYVDNNACKSSQPISSKSCYLGACTNSKFFTAKWNKCSKSCGLGYQRRRVSCEIKTENNNNKNTVLPLAACAGDFPVNTRPCNDRICKTYDWFSYNFGSCSEKCGGGVQIKMISCRHTRTGVTVFNYLCPKPRPFPIEDCNIFPC